MLTWLFGKIQINKVFVKEQKLTSGYLEFEKARVRWFLSTDSKYLPKSALKKNQTTFRSITINKKELEFSGGFTDLHTLVYKDILNGKGYGLNDVYQSIEIVHNIRNSKVELSKGYENPFLKKIKNV
tara:strand:- start:149 stop:529 length:381 start_codon:yes stop_codon:yes gene_type:complete